ncbi:DUF6458 family protein [Arthrobacter sedimenti]|uniref:DUF6458 family protein n=1 Tax=Arthrobacter sedimenti TaxID=2694931 RepID=UPI000B35D3A2|nr:DUF6458 family protein [Arthrobacter sedimenti]OUM45299.1 hypothetical protein B8W73_00900 [Arthrobacter agilis]
MRIGSSIFLIAVGAILTFAFNADVVSVVDLDMVGWILMGVGVIGLIASIIMSAPRRQHRISESRSGVDPNTGEAVTRNETRDSSI